MRSKRAVLAIILVSYVMIVLDTSIVITGLAKIQADLGFTTVQLSWVQSAYTLAFGGLLLLGARAGDLLGRKRMFLTGLGVFTVASIGVGVADSAWVMLLARALQGVGAAILAPSTLALLQTNFAEGPERTRAVAYYGAVAGIGASIGLVLGGLLADALSWRVGFFINIPIGAALAWGTARYIAETERRQGKFDLAGATTSTAGMVALVYGIVRSAEYGWANAGTIGSLLVAAVMLTTFVMVEARALQPVMPLRLFADTRRVGAFVARLLFLGAMAGFFYFTTQFMQGVLGFTPLQAGMGFLPMTLVNFAVAMAVPSLTARFGNVRLMVFGLATACAGMVLLSHAQAGGSYLLGVALPMMIIGLGQGCTLSPLTVAGVQGVRPEDAGAASGVVNVAHQLGLALGLSVAVVAFSGAAGEAGVGSAGITGLANGISAALGAGAVMLAMAVVVVVLTSGALRRRTTVVPQENGA